MNKKRILWLASVVLLFLAGCEAKLSDDKEEFSSDAYVYQFQLPDSWKKRTEVDYKGEFGEKTVFGAEDMQSKSHMFVQVSSKNVLDMTNFGDATRENLQKIYGYSNLEDIYMKEYEIEGNQVYKYTLNGKYGDDSVWVHSYYMVTEHEVLEFVFYSADDNRYEDRVKIIDASIDTVREKSERTDTTSSSETETSEPEGVSETTVKNNQMTINVTGFRKITVDDKEYLAVRYAILNTSKEEIKPIVWYDKVTVKQGETVLKQAEFPDSDEAGNLKVLSADNDVSLKKGESGLGLAFYSLAKDEGQTVYVEFSESEFEQKEPIGFDLNIFK